MVYFPMTIKNRFNALIIAVIIAVTGCAKSSEAPDTWPKNDGFIGQPKEEILLPGTKIDRYGGSACSEFFSPPGTPKAARALPPAVENQPLRTFEIVKPLKVESGTVAPAFGEPGLGTQYITPVTLEEMLKRSIIHEVK